MSVKVLNPDERDLRNIVFAINQLAQGLFNASSANLLSGALANAVMGLWTPTLQGSSTPGAPTYTTQVGRYEQIGKLILARFTIVTTALGSPVGSMQIGGLPFASENTASSRGAVTLGQVSGWTGSAGYTWLAGDVLENTSAIRLVSNGSGKTAALSPLSEFGAATTLQGLAIYRSA